MSDLKNPRIIILKGFLFLGLGIFAAGLLLLYAPSLTVAALLALAVWAFCRFYYFAFYVLENYVDSTYRFRGIIHALRFSARRLWGGKSEATDEKKSS